MGAPEEILKQAKPHIGTDKLRLVVRSIREEILRLGGEIRFREQATDFILEKGALKGVVTSRKPSRPRLWCWPWVTAPGIPLHPSIKKG